MNLSINRIEIQGYLGQDPETRAFANGGSVMEVRVATSQGWKNKSTGEWQEKSEWHTVQIFNNGLVKLLQKQNLAKGDLFRAVGQLETRKWQDKDGNDRYTTQITVRGYEHSAMVVRTKNTPQGQSEAA